VKVGIAADHGGFELKQQIAGWLREAGHEVVDFGAQVFDADDDYPDFVVPLAQAVAGGDVKRGIAICGSGVGACIIANKLDGVRAALIQDTFSAHQGVEDDDMNVLCLGGRTVGAALAQEIARTFLNARFSNHDRHRRRIDKITAVERTRRSV